MKLRLVQLYLLVWKCWKVESRNRIRIILQVVWPIFMFLILLIVRLTKTLRFPQEECHFDARPLPSAGLLPFFQGFVCTFNNTCQASKTLSENSTYPFRQVPLVGLLRETADFLRVVNNSGLLDTLPNDARVMQDFLVVILNDTATTHMNFSDLFEPDSVDQMKVELGELGLSSKATRTLFEAHLNGPGVAKVLTKRGQESPEKDSEALDRLIDIGRGRDELTRDEICDTDIIKIILRPAEDPNDESLDQLQDEMCEMDDDQLKELGKILRQNLSIRRNFLPKLRHYISYETDMELLTDAAQLRSFFRETRTIFRDGSTADFIRDLRETQNLTEAKLDPDNPLSLIAPFWYPLCNRPFPVGEMLNAFQSYTKDSDVDKSFVDEVKTDPILKKNESQICREMMKNQTYDNSTSCECNAFMLPFQRVNFLWRLVKPILKGRVLYYPDTPLVRRIMRMVRIRVDVVGQLSRALGQFIEIGDRIRANYDFEAFGELESVYELVDAFSEAELNDTTSLLPNRTRDRIERFQGNGTRNLKRFIKAIDEIDLTDLFENRLPNIKRKLDCLSSTKRFEPVDSSFELVRRGMQLADDENLWAAIEFYDVDKLNVSDFTNDSLPHLIKYAIRMDPDLVDSTNFVKDRPSKVSLRRDPFRDMKYFSSGFIYLQDAIDKAIIRIHTEEIRSRSSNRTEHMNDVERSRRVLQAKASTIGAIMQMFPFPCYIEDVFLQTLGKQLTMYIVLGWIYQAAMIVKSVVLEKERKLREVARIMGISPGLHFASWNIFWFFLMMVTVILFIIIIVGGGVLIHSNSGPVFLIMMAYSASTISFCFFISSFFNRANIAAVVGGLVYFLTYIAYGAIASFADSYEENKMLAASLLPNVALGFAWEIIGEWELKTEGTQLANFGKPISNQMADMYTLRHAFFMLIFDAFGYYFMAWYVDTVFPGEYGVPRPWYFLFQPSFWCDSRSKKSNRNSSSSDANMDSLDSSSSGENSPTNQHSQENGQLKLPQSVSRIEPEPKHLPIGCAIKGLVKTFKPSIFSRFGQIIRRSFRKLWFLIKKDARYNVETVREIRPAVDNLTLNMYEGQITALLGHNGAGKTTTMSIMCGLFPASSGQVLIKGLDVAREIDDVRSLTGFCPQFNVLYDDLTVTEHLWFYGRIRASFNTKFSLQEEIEALLKHTNLEVKRNEQARHLSGGMRRRLSIAVAFIGSSKCVILDEPTAGVDPYARRQIWDLISRFRKDRTIILSTHHMDEAEILSDRIAVLSQGKLQTCGSPLFLKQTFGDGYGLVIVRDVPAFLKQAAERLSASMEDSGVTSSTRGSEVEIDTDREESVRYHSSASSVLTEADRRHEEAITQFVARYFEGAYQLVEHAGQEIHYRIAYSGLPKFAQFFEALDKNVGELCIGNYGLSDTSLEEIFIKIADEADIGEEQVETFTEAGNLPRPVTRLTFRGRLRRAAMKMMRKKKWASSTDSLSAIASTSDDSRSVASSSEVSSVSGSCPPPTVGTMPQYTPVTGIYLVFLQLYALILKRAHRTRRNWKGFITEIILPAVFVFLGVVLIKLGGYKPTNPPPLELDPWELTPGSAIAQDRRLYSFYAAVNSSDPLARDLEKAFTTSEYAGTRCLSNYTIDKYKCDWNSNDSEWKQSSSFRQKTCFCSEKSGLQECEETPEFSATLMAADNVTMSPTPDYFNWPSPKSRRMQTSDDLLNLTRIDVSQYIINQYGAFRQNLYGGFTFLVQQYGLNQSEADAYYDVLVDLAETAREGVNRSWTNNTRPFRTIEWRNMSGVVNNLRNRTQTLANRTAERAKNISAPIISFINNRTNRTTTTVKNTMLPTITRKKREVAAPFETTTARRSFFRLLRNVTAPDVNRTALASGLNTTIQKFTNQSRVSNAVDDLVNRWKNFTNNRNRTRVPIFNRNETTDAEIDDLVYFLSNGLFAPASLQIWYNNKGWPSSVAYNNYANNLLLRLAMSRDVNQPDTSYGIVAFNHPLNYTRDEFSTQMQRAVFIDVLMAIMLILAMSFVPASFVIFLIEDRKSDSKHVQMVSGLKPWIYWFANYLWDCASYTIPSLICLLIFAFFNIEAYVNEKSSGCLLLLLLLYGFAVTPMLYPCSLFLSTPSTAFVLLACANLFIGSATTIATYMLDMLQTEDSSLIPVNNILKNIFFIFPQYCLGRGLLNMALSYRTAQSMAYIFGTGIRNHDPAKWKVCGQFFFALILHSAGWFFVNLLIEYGPVLIARLAARLPACCKRSKNSLNFDSQGRYLPTNDPKIAEDPDVARERQMVMSENTAALSNLTLIVRNLTKTFKTSRGKLTAVEQLTFGVPAGQCFGLLGVNGAGKTTTFRMLTGHIHPTAGHAAIHGHDIGTHRTQANRLIGYCPQADCITPLLSGRENLEFFARLRGVPESLVKQVAAFNISRMDLRRHADKPARHYSGGNKRKLSVAISLTGEPPLVFLDEPTAGIDPRARRFLWRAISQLLLHGQSVILTTHSMDECEALCTRLAIMVNGRFRCLGSPQHLKAKFGEGYFVTIRFAPNSADAQAVSQMTDMMRAQFADTLLKEWHDTVATFSLGASGKYRLDLGKLFAFLTDPTFQTEMHIADFSVTQSSLDAVFVAFAKSQSTELADKDRVSMLGANNIDGGGSSSRPTSGAISFENKLTGLPIVNNDVTIQSGNRPNDTGFENPLFEPEVL